ncbi:MAG: hypothetical protein QM749_00365 [Aquabacterium sp.]
MIALNLARRLNADELMVMQNLYIVHGQPGWSSKFLIASVNTCGRYESLRYEWRGTPGTDDYGCRAWTIEKSTGEKLFGIWVDWKMVKAEGWCNKSGSKWKTMPDQMFIYRSAAFWQRGYAPEISMGLSSAEELADVVDVRSDGSYTVTSESLRTDMPSVDSDGVITHSPSPTVGSTSVKQAQAEAVQQTRSQAEQKAAPAQQNTQSAGRNASAAKQQAATPAFDLDGFADKLAACSDPDTLDTMADEASGLLRDQVIDQDQFDTLMDVYRRRRDDINGGQLVPPASQTAAQQGQQTTTRRRSSSAAGQAPE